MNKITIAVDGYSSTGKSTIAKELAKKLHYIYVDSGAMYRAVTLYAMNRGFISSDGVNKGKLVAELEAINLKFIYNPTLGFAEMYLNEINVENEIRSLEVSNEVSKVAQIPEVRKNLVEIQQQLGKNKGVVMDGRDIGTVVFPDAELKLFLNATADERTQRRFNELIKRGDKVTYDEILKNVMYRDHIDSTRQDSPLVKADDAIEIDNSDLTKEEQFEKVYQLVVQTLKGQNK